MLQALALASVCLTSVILVVVLGGAILRSATTQQRGEAQLRELLDVRSKGLRQRSDIWRLRAEGKPATGAVAFADYARFRQGALRLVQQRVGGDGPAAAQARKDIVASIAEIDALASGFLGSNRDRRAEKAAVEGTDAPAAVLDNALDRWLVAATARVDEAGARSRTLWRNLFWLIVGLLSSLGVIGLALWFGLERARARLMRALRSSERRFRSLVQNSSDAVMVVDAAGAIVYASQPTERLFGCRPADLVNRQLHELVDDEDFSAMSHLAHRGTTVLDNTEPIEWRTRHPDGGTRYVETVCSRQLDDVAVNGYVLNTRDISERKEMEATLTHRAFHDSLTDLANRALFVDRVSHALSFQNREGTIVAVVMLDLDDFKIVNDSLGHAAGDALLIDVAQRIRSVLRVTDTAARLGGDEFAILVESVSNVDEVRGLAERIGEALREPITLDGREVVIQGSLGIALSSDAAVTAPELIRNADVAMYAAKQRGRAGYAVFDPSMAENATNRLALTSELHRALERDQLSLAYQPIVNLDTHCATAVEVLMRWNHPTYGAIEPTVFIPIAEETGLISTFGAWALRTALNEAMSWSWDGADELQVSVNVAVRQLEQPDFIDIVKSALTDSGFPARRLNLEITESDVMRDSERMLEQLTALKGLGVVIAIDDFGTGYSSLSYLAKLPIDLVKIDRSFVSGLSAGQRDARIASMIVGIGDSLGLSTIAEGVEDLDQVEGLRELGCVRAQGFYFSKPLSSSELRRLLAQTSALQA